MSAMTENGHTALSQAVSEHHPAIIRLLARHGASLSAGHKGFTAIHLAAILDDSNCASALLECGADIDAHETEIGQTPLMEALSEGDADFMGPNVARLLIECGADVSIKNLSGEKALDYVNDYEAAWIAHSDSPWLGASQRALIELVRWADGVHEAERAKETHAIRMGLEASDAGRVRPLAEFAAEMRAKYNLPVHLSDEEIFSGERGTGSKVSL